jgi:hypothetical protein
MVLGKCNILKKLCVDYAVLGRVSVAGKLRTGFIFGEAALVKPI